MIDLSAGKYWGLKRLADKDGRFKMTAVDQRPPIKNPIAKHHGTDQAPFSDVHEVKRLLVEELQGSSTAMLLDPHYILSQGLTFYDPTKGLIITLEDSVFEEDDDGRMSSEIDDWSVSQIKRVGGDAVKVLAWYRPDAPQRNLELQQDFTKRIGDACAKYDIPYLFELLVYPLKSDVEQTKDYVEMATKHSDHVLKSVEEFAKPDYGVDIFKLESPLPAKQVPGSDGEGAKEAQALFDELGHLANRPWVMLSAGAGKEDFGRVLDHAYKAGASGYLAGRAIWLDAFGAYPDMEKMRAGLQADSVPYMTRLNELTDANALPWSQHACYGANGASVKGIGEGFRHQYPAFEG